MSIDLDKWVSLNITKVDAIDESYHRGELISETYPRYSTNISLSITILGVSNMSLSGGWAFDDYVRVLNENGETLATANNPAMAICLGAYKLATGEDWKE